MILELYRSKKNILTTRDIAILWGMQDKDNLKSKISYHVKRGNLIRLRKGIFTKDENYDPKELATSVFTPSYISFETALRETGVIFQYYETVFAASYLRREIKCDKYKFSYRKIKNEVLINQSGIIIHENYSIASRERAFLDMIYLSPNYYFDNLRGMDWDKCFELVKIYKKKSLLKTLNNYYKYVK